MNGLIITYLILGIAYSILKMNNGKGRLEMANNFFIAIIAIILLSQTIASNFANWYSGIAYEYFAFQLNQFGSIFYLKLMVSFLLLTLPILNIWRKFRSKVNFQVLIFLIGLANTLLEYKFYGKDVFLPRISFNGGVSPGWYTKIVEPMNTYEIVLMILAGIIITFILSRNKKVVAS